MATAILTEKSDVLALLNQSKSIDVQVWTYILAAFPNDMWRYPANIFLYWNLEKWNNFKLRKATRFQYVQLLHNLARFLYSQSFNKKNKAAIKNEMAEVITKITHDEPYTPQIEVTEDFMQNFDRNLPFNLRHGFCTIVEFAQPDRIKEFRGHEPRLMGHSHKTRLEISNIEHILPKNWKDKDYIEWNDETASSVMNTIGNLMLLEKPYIIDGKPLSFIGKLIYYRRSIFLKNKLLSNKILNRLDNNEYDWRYSHYLERQNECKKTLRDFFEGKYLPK
jgi:hypothetical protein